jgi:hypothetical protein
MKLAKYYSLYDVLNPKVPTKKFINTATKKVNKHLTTTLKRDIKFRTIVE